MKYIFIPHNILFHPVNSFLLTFLIIFYLKFNKVNSSLKFPVKHNKERCFIEDVTGLNEFLIKYKIGGFDDGTSQEDEIHVIENFRIYIYKDGNLKSPLEVLSLNDKKGKIVVRTEKINELKICVKFVNGISRKVKNHFDLRMGMEFSSVIQKEINTNSALKKDSVSSFRTLSESILNIILTIIDLQTKEISQEDETAKDIIYCGKLYYYLGIIQIIFIVSISMLHIVNFKKMLYQKRVI